MSTNMSRSAPAAFSVRTTPAPEANDSGGPSPCSRPRMEAVADREVRSRMAALGADPSGNTPEEFARFIRDDQAKWAKLMREAGIKME